MVHPHCTSSVPEPSTLEDTLVDYHPLQTLLDLGTRYIQQKTTVLDMSSRTAPWENKQGKHLKIGRVPIPKSYYAFSVEIPDESMPAQQAQTHASASDNDPARR